MQWEHLTATEFRQASPEKGRRMVKLLVDSMAEYIAAVKADRAVPALTREFARRSAKLSRG